MARVKAWTNFFLSRLRRLVADDRGATTLEWALLMAAIAIPTYWTFRIALAMIVDYYTMMTLLNNLPFP